MRVILVIAGFLYATVAQAQTRPVCMSDDEFRAFLHEALLFQVGYGGAVCCKRDTLRPGSCRLVTRQTKRIEEVGAAYFRINRATALQPFERAFPGSAERAFRRYSDVLEQRAKQFVDEFGEQQCESWLNAIEALSYVRENDLGEFLTSRLVSPAEFARERRQIPSCE
jgi:hypothetical protein